MKQKILFPVLIIILIPLFGFSQTAENGLIDNVENGLVKQTIVPFGEHIQTGNIYDRLKAYKVNGVSIAVIDNYQIAWAKTYGVADNSKQNPVTAETLFQCASIGKVITSLVALSLVREHKIGLDENVNNKLISWKIEENEFTKNEKVTLRRLLSHSAGLSDDYGFEGYEPGDEIPSLLQILRNERPSNAKKEIKVTTIPGTVERYSGGGYLIIQQLIQDISGQSFDSYVQEHVFSKLDMDHTTYNFMPDVHLGLPIARGHYKNGKVDKKKEYHIYPEMAAAGPWTTATDLAKLVIQIQKEYKGNSDLIIGQELCREMLTPQINYKGLGVHLKGAEKPEAFWHAGNNAGYIGLLYGIISAGQGAVVLTNSDSGENLSLEIITGIANAYNWPVMKTLSAMEVSKEEIQNYVGSYQSESGTTIIIGENSNGLFLIPSSPKKELTLSKTADNEFTLPEASDYIKIFFDRTPDGTVVGVNFTQNMGRTDHLTKTE